MDTQFRVSAFMEKALPIAGSARLTEEPRKGVMKEERDATVRMIALLPLAVMEYDQ